MPMPGGAPPTQDRCGGEAGQKPPGAGPGARVLKAHAKVRSSSAAPGFPARRRVQRTAPVQRHARLAWASMVRPVRQP